MWQGVNNELMSDEEDGPDHTFVMKTLEWRAHQLTGLIKSLDDRLDRARNKNIARKERVYGSPSKRPPSEKLNRRFIQLDSDDTHHGDMDEEDGHDIHHEDDFDDSYFF